MKRLLLFTVDAPYGRGAAAFEMTELPYLSRSFDTWMVSSNQTDPLTVTLPENVRASRLSQGIGAWDAFSTLLCGDFWRELAAALWGRPGRLLRRGGFVLYSYLHAFHAFHALEKQVETERFVPDVIYSFWAWETAYAALLLKKKHPAAQVVIRAHGYDLYRERTRYDWQPFRKAIGRKADCIAFISCQGRDYWNARWGKMTQASMTVDYLGCGAREWAYTPGGLSLVSCSLVGSVKRVDLIVRALALMEIPVQWTHFGDGPAMGETVALAHALLDGRDGITYRFAGRVDNASLPGRYRAAGANLFVNVSQSEGLPVSMMEAAAMGLPLMGTDVGGVKEIITGETGVLLPPELTASALAGALTEYAGLAGEKKQALSKGAFRRWERLFDSGVNAAAFTGKLLELTEEGH